VPKQPPVPRAVVLTAGASVLVSAAALITAAVLRPPPPGSLEAGATSEGGCQGGGCALVASATVGSERVELLAGKNGEAGTLRAGTGAARTLFDVAITHQGARLDSQSLNCVDGATPACLVRGRSDAGTLGDVFVSHQGSWSQTDRKFISDDDYLALHDVLGDSAPEVVAVQRRCQNGGSTDCPDPAYFAQVFSLTGNVLGCTTPVAEVSSLPGENGEVIPAYYNVHTCE
jgi:hypothetical protein